MAGCLLPNTHICFGFAISGSCNNIPINSERNETSGQSKEWCRPPVVPLSFSSVSISTQQPHMDITKRKHWRSKAKARMVFLMTRNQHGSSFYVTLWHHGDSTQRALNSMSEQRGGVGFYENLNFCFF